MNKKLMLSDDALEQVSGGVSGAALSAVPVATFAEALQGKIASVQVLSVDSAPGGGAQIRIR